MQALGLLGSAFVGILHPASILMMIAGVAIGIIFWFYPGTVRVHGSSADAAAYLQYDTIYGT